MQAVVLIDAATVTGFEELRRDPGVPYTDPEATLSVLGDAINGIVP